MKRMFSFFAVIIASTVFLSGCATHFYQSANENISKTDVVLSQKNFRVIGEVEGSSTATIVLGIGGLSKKSIRGNAVAAMYKNARLSSSQTITNINIKSAVTGFPPFYIRRIYTATGIVVEFTE